MLWGNLCFSTEMRTAKSAGCVALLSPLSMESTKKKLKISWISKLVQHFFLALFTVQYAILTFASATDWPISHDGTVKVKPLQQKVYMVRNLVCFSRLANGRNAGVIHNYCEITNFVKTQNSKNRPVLLRCFKIPLSNLCRPLHDSLSTKMRRRCSHFNSSGKGQGYFAERRMQNGIVLRRLENNAKLLSRPICILRTMPFYVLRSAKYPCRLVKVTKRTVLSPFKVVVTTQTCFQLVIYWVPAEVWSNFDIRHLL